MKIGFLQTSPIFGEKDKNLGAAVSKMRQLDADLIVLPELFNTGYQFTSREETLELSEKVPEGKTTQALISLSKEKCFYIVAGLAERENDICYNSAVLVGPEGFIGCYRKIHLYCNEKLWFEPGDANTGLCVYDIGRARIGMMVCFDWFFPEVARYLAAKGADVICHPSNLVLPYCPQAMITRCLENRVFAVTANRIGVENRFGENIKPMDFSVKANDNSPLRFIGTSQITGTKGEVLYRASQDKEESKVVEINPEDARNKQMNSFNHIFNDRRVTFNNEGID